MVRPAGAVGIRRSSSTSLTSAPGFVRTDRAIDDEGDRPRDQKASITGDHLLRGARRLGRSRRGASRATASTRPSRSRPSPSPDALAGRDLCGKAKTGSGKTLAFGLPLARASREGRAPPARPGSCSCPRASSPTRCSTSSGRSRASRAAASSPSTAASGFEPQIDALQQGVDVIVGTPGRLIDLMERGEVIVRSRSRCSCSTKPTAWPTWASCPRCRRSSTAWSRSTRRCSSPRRSTVPSSSSSSATCTTRCSTRSSPTSRPSRRWSTASSTSTTWTR